MSFKRPIWKNSNGSYSPGTGNDSSKTKPTAITTTATFKEKDLLVKVQDIVPGGPPGHVRHHKT